MYVTRPGCLLEYIRTHELPLNDVLSIVDDPLSGYTFSKKDVLAEIERQKRWLRED